MGHEVTGRIHAIFDTAQVSERFTKREFVVVLADNPKYPQLVQFQLTGDRVGQLDELRVGDEVTIEFSLRGREWKSPKGEVKYFNSLDAWRVALSAPKGRDRGAPPPDQTVPHAGPDDDIPFATAAIGHEPSAVWRHFR